MKKIAVILSGNGVFDGAEINETVLTLLAIENNGLDYECFAPNKTQHHVINHITGQDMQESRNVMVEAARIVRGKIHPLSECNASDFSALIVPGGFGVAKNLSDFAFKSTATSLCTEFISVCKDFKEKDKPAGYMCIAPALLPKIYGKGVMLTIGNDKDTASAIQEMGGVHENAAVDQIVVDRKNKVVTTPAYMLATKISEAKAGIDKLVCKVVELI
jgi:enhancing lycopene biosynthesis protein 2